MVDLGRRERMNLKTPDIYAHTKKYEGDNRVYIYIQREKKRERRHALKPKVGSPPDRVNETEADRANK